MIAVLYYATPNVRLRGFRFVSPGAAVAILLLLFAQYWFIWRHLEADESSFWARKYGVFYDPSRRQSFGSWWLARSTTTASGERQCHRACGTCCSHRRNISSDQSQC